MCIRDSARLAGTGSGKNEQRAFAMLNRGPLRRVELGEEALNRRRAGRDRRCVKLRAGEAAPGRVLAVS